MNKMLIQILGWLGAFLLAVCGLPQLFKTIKTKNFDSLSITFIWCWLLGELFLFTYVVYEAFKWPLLFNYGINIGVCVIILSLFLTIRNNKNSVNFKSKIIKNEKKRL